MHWELEWRLFFLEVGIGLWRWKSNLIDENTKEKMTRGKLQTFRWCKNHKEWKDQRGLGAKLIFFNLASVCFVCSLASECKIAK
jgi:hypothetical protein